MFTIQAGYLSGQEGPLAPALMNLSDRYVLKIIDLKYGVGSN
jgi:hypothetical protein